MRVLLAVGNGVSSPAVAALRGSLINSGCDVLLIGADRQDTLALGERPEDIELINDDPLSPIYKLDGTPTDCIHFAFASGLADHVSVAIAGFGASPSLNSACAGSLEVDAAKEAATMGRLAISFRFDSVNSVIFDELPSESDCVWCGIVLSELAAWMIASPPPVRGFLEVRLPSKLLGRGLKIADPSDKRAPAPDHISVTPVSICGSDELSRARFTAWTEATITSINPRLGAGDGRCHAGCCG